MKIVLDTNVLVSALLTPSGKSAAILRLLLNFEIQVALDARILAEYREVLLRPLFGFMPEYVENLLDFLWDEAILTTGSPLHKPLPDPGDEPFLEVALAARVEALITGNKRHFPATASEGIQVLSPSEFLEFFQSGR